MISAVWIEIPVKDIERAAKFYQSLFGLEASEIANDGVRHTITLNGGGAGGIAGISLNQTKNFDPSDKGILVYFDTGEDLTPHLNRVQPAGGRIMAGKTSMGAAGYFASVLDSEGNLIALYSVK